MKRYKIKEPNRGPGNEKDNREMKNLLERSKNRFEQTEGIGEHEDRLT